MTKEELPKKPKNEGQQLDKNAFRARVKEATKNAVGKGKNPGVESKKYWDKKKD